MKNDDFPEDGGTQPDPMDRSRNWRVTMKSSSQDMKEAMKKQIEKQNIRFIAYCKQDDRGSYIVFLVTYEHIRVHTLEKNFGSGCTFDAINGTIHQNSEYCKLSKYLKKLGDEPRRKTCQSAVEMKKKGQSSDEDDDAPPPPRHVSKKRKTTDMMDGVDSASDSDEVVPYHANNPLKDTINRTILNPLAGTSRNDFKKIVSKLDKHDGAVFGAIDSEILKINACLGNISDTVYASYHQAAKKLLEQETKVVEDPRSSLDKEKLKEAQITIEELDAVIRALKHTLDRGTSLYCDFHGEMCEYAEELKDVNPDLWGRMKQTLDACTREEIGDGKPQLIKQPKLMRKVAKYLGIQQDIVHEIVQMRARMIQQAKELMVFKEAAPKK